MPWEGITEPRQLVGLHETATFDANKTYDLTLPTTAFEMAKDVAALASALGGSIVVGAVEPRGAITALVDVENPCDLIKKHGRAIASTVVLCRFSNPRDFARPQGSPSSSGRRSSPARARWGSDSGSVTSSTRTSLPHSTPVRL